METLKMELRMTVMVLARVVMRMRVKVDIEV